jgi:hypothetical protein
MFRRERERQMASYQVFNDLDVARRRLALEGGWIVRCQDGSGNVAWTDDEGIVVDLLGTEYVTQCEARQCWDETVLHRSGHPLVADLERI